MELTTFEVEAIFENIDTNNDGTLSFDEFIKASYDGNLTKPAKMSQKQAAKLKKHFEDADKDKSGSLTIKELKDLLNSLGEKLSEMEVEAILDNADTDGNGTIDFNEFMKAAYGGDLKKQPKLSDK